MHMSQVIDFKKWLSGPSRPRTSYDLYALWRAATGRSEGQYQSEVRPGGQVVIAGPSSETLVLVSPRAILAFKFALEGLNVAPLTKGIWSEVEDPTPDRVMRSQASKRQVRFR
jgi:hypothetical protein